MVRHIDIDHTGLIGVHSTTRGGGDTVQAHGATGATETIDPAVGNVHTLTLDANCTITLTAPASGVSCAIEVYLTQDGTGSRLVTWPGSVEWPGGTAPTLSTAADSVDRIVLETLNGGTTWFGAIIGSSGGSALTIKEEGVDLATAATSLDFVGAGVVASGTGAAKTITIAGGGGGSGALTFIAEDIVVGAATAQLNVTAIPSTYRDLVIVIMARSSAASVVESVLLQVGNASIDTGANYRHQRDSTGTGNVNVSGTGVSSVSAGMASGASATAGSFDPTDIEIIAYAATAFWRRMFTKSVYYVTDRYLNTGQGTWVNTADAIERVRATLSAGNFEIGSRMAVYGRG